MKNRTRLSLLALIASLLIVASPSAFACDKDEEAAQKKRENLHTAWSEHREGAEELKALRDALIKLKCKDVDEKAELSADLEQLRRRERRWWRLKRQVRRALQRGDRELAEELLLEAKELLRQDKARRHMLKSWKETAEGVEGDLSEKDGLGDAQRKIDRTELPQARWDFGSEIFAGQTGLGGIRGVVDARRVLPVLENPISDEPSVALRIAARFDTEIQEQEFRQPGRRAERRTERWNTGLLLGLSIPRFLVPLELGLYARGYERVDLDFEGQGDPRDREEGFGDVEFGLKIPVPVDAIGLSRGVAIALYGTGRVETGSRSKRPSRAEYGVALSLFPLGQKVELHLNLGGYSEEVGVMAFRYRSALSYSTDLSGRGDAVLRVSVGVEGLEYEGRPTSDVDLTGGVQVLLWQIVTLELSGSLRVVHSGFRGQELRSSQHDRGIFERHTDDYAYGLTFSLGVAF